MTDPHVAAVGGSPSFPPLVARVLGGAPEDVLWLPSVTSAERALAEATQPFDVIVLAPGVKDEEAMGMAELASKEAPTTAVIVVREAPVDGAFPRLVRAGVRDVVDLSRGSGEFKDALKRAVEWSAGVRGTTSTVAREETRRGVIVCIFSTKGGTGKTFLSCNLAAALAERSGKEVGLLDLDHDLGDVFAYFGAAPRRSLAEVLTLEEDADAAEVTQLGTQLASGVTGFGSPPDPRAEPIPSAAITRMLLTLREAFPFTIVDATSEYSDHVLSAFDMADAIYLVGSLDAIAVRHMSIGIQTLQSLGVPRERLRFVLNRSDSKVDLTVADIEHLLGIRVHCKIPSSPLVPRSINRGRLLWHEERRSQVAKGIESLADALCEEFAPETPAPAESRHRIRRGR